MYCNTEKALFDKGEVFFHGGHISAQGAEKNAADGVHHGRNDAADPFGNAFKNPIQHAVLPRIIAACNQRLQIGYRKAKRVQDDPGNDNAF